ncbi:MAG: FHA domain-containing protein [Kofleriaceae bacterium]
MIHSAFRVVCDRSWDELPPQRDGVRFCDRCKRDVHACDDVATARQLSAANACVALAHDAARKPGPLGPMVTKMGMINSSDDGTLPIVGWLVVLDGPMQNLTLQLAATTTTLGSAPPADFVLPDDTIAALHVELRCHPAGFTVVDRSERGFLANEQPASTHELVDNDLLQLGATRLKFKTVN